MGVTGVLYLRKRLEELRPSNQSPGFFKFSKKRKLPSTRTSMADQIKHRTH